MLCYREYGSVTIDVLILSNTLKYKKRGRYYLPLTDFVRFQNHPTAYALNQKRTPVVKAMLSPLVDDGDRDAPVTTAKSR